MGLSSDIALPELVDGREGKALQFDGANFLTLGDIGDFEHYHRFSLGAWIQHTGTHTQRAGIMSRRNGEIRKQGYDLTLTTNNRLSLRLIHEEGDTYLEVTTKSTIAPRQWTHVLATYDGSAKASGVQLYINGQAQPVTGGTR